MNNGERLYFYDILIDGYKKIIEINGDYWHCNPKIYKPEDLFYFKKNPIFASDKWEMDRIKIDYAKQSGYDVMVVWESDIRRAEKWNKIKEEILKYARS
jgi:G:T-mismatch repair DNA endonuclease (very short patch repair protein)